MRSSPMRTGLLMSGITHLPLIAIVKILIEEWVAPRCGEGPHE